MKSFTYTLLHQWHIIRWLRLGIGIFMGIQSALMRDSVSGLFAVFLLFQAITNTGCCGSTGCDISQKKRTPTQHNSDE